MTQRQNRFFLKRSLLLLFSFLVLLGSSQVRADGKETISINSGQGPQTFIVEIMETPSQLERGLMYRRTMPTDHGMLFNFHSDQPVMMWMKNTYLPLDMIFTDKTGKITWIAENAEPLSEAIIPSHGSVYSVLEINGGLAAKLKIHVGDMIKASIFVP